MHAPDTWLWPQSLYISISSMLILHIYWIHVPNYSKRCLDNNVFYMAWSVSWWPSRKTLTNKFSAKFPYLINDLEELFIDEMVKFVSTSRVNVMNIVSHFMWTLRYCCACTVYAIHKIVLKLQYQSRSVWLYRVIYYWYIVHFNNALLALPATL